MHAFLKLCVFCQERTKIERETVNRVKGRDRSDDRAQEGKLEDIGKPTSAVVTIILALYGKMDTKVSSSSACPVR